MRFLATLLFVLMPMTAGVHAAQPADALRVSEIEAQQHALRDVLNTRSGRYDAMPKAKRKKILASQDRLFVLIEGRHQHIQCTACGATYCDGTCGLTRRLTRQEGGRP